MKNAILNVVKTNPSISVKYLSISLNILLEHKKLKKSNECEVKHARKSKKK